MPQAKIKIFWDLETCPPPTSSYSSPWEMLKDFRLFTAHFGVVTTFKAYWDSNKNKNKTGSSSTSDAASKFRIATSSMGVDLMDCSLTEGYSRDAVARRLAVDVLISAIDEAQSVDSGNDDNTIIMVLSGDSSILYPISLLMFRNYTVFLVVPDENESVQDFQATRTFKWHRDVLGFKLKRTNEIQGSVLLNGEGDRQGERPPMPSASTATTAAALSVYSSPSSRTIPSDILLSATPRGKLKTLSAIAAENLKSRASSIREPPNPSHRDGSLATEGSDNQPEIHPQIPSPSPGSPGSSGWGPSAGADWGITDNDTCTPGSSEDLAKTDNSSSINQNGLVITAAGVQEVVKEVPLSTFDPLLQILREAKKRSMARSKLGEELAKKNKDTGIYKSAGVKGFGDYISLAAKKNLILVGGFDNNQYVKLHPTMKNVQQGG